MNVLLVDDETELVTTLAERLGLRGINARWATDAEEALRLLQTEPFDIAVLDMKLPRVDGLEVLRHLKSSEALRAIPVVVLTSSREDRDLEEAYRLGANAYVVKPVDFRAFTDAVRTLGLFWAIVNEPPGTPQR